MKNIDTHTWKSVPLTDLFEPVLSEGDNKANRLEDGDIPLISSGSFNNGIAKMVKEGDGVSKMFVGNVLTIDMFGKAFYQPNPFLTVSHGRVNILLPKFEMTPAIGLFFVTLLNREYRDKYSFTTMCNQNQLLNESLIIPWKDNQPDFAYMEQYIRSLEQRVQTTLTSFEHLIQLPKHAVDTTKWKAYRLGDLYEKICLSNFQKIDKRHDVSLEKTPEYPLPLVNAKDGNNGIMYYGKDSVFQGIEMTIDIVQNGAVATGNVYAQPQKTGVLWDAYLIKAKHHQDTKYTLLFLAAVIQKMIKSKYGYNNKAIWEKVKDNEILLPTSPDGTPDFSYMEQYMQKIERRVQQNLDKIA